MAERVKREIKATKPYQFDETADPQLMVLQQQVAKVSALNAELMTKLADSNLKVRGRDELRDVESFNAETKRMEAEIKMLKELLLSPQQKAQMEHELETQSRQHIFDSIQSVNQSVLDNANSGPPQ